MQTKEDAINRLAREHSAIYHAEDVDEAYLDRIAAWFERHHEAHVEMETVGESTDRLGFREYDEVFIGTDVELDADELWTGPCPPVELEIA